MARRTLDIVVLEILLIQKKLSNHAIAYSEIMFHNMVDALIDVGHAHQDLLAK